MSWGHVCMKIQEQQPSASIPIHKVQKRNPWGSWQESLPLLPKEKVSQPPQMPEQGANTAVSTVQDSSSSVVPSQTRRSCSVLGTPSCSVGWEGWLGGGCPKLLLQDLIHILTRFPKPASLCAAKTLLQSFNLLCHLERQGDETNFETEDRTLKYGFWGTLLPIGAVALPGRKQFLLWALP